MKLLMGMRLWKAISSLLYKLPLMCFQLRRHLHGHPKIISLLTLTDRSTRNKRSFAHGMPQTSVTLVPKARMRAHGTQAQGINAPYAWVIILLCTVLLSIVVLAGVRTRARTRKAKEERKANIKAKAKVPAEAEAAFAAGENVSKAGTMETISGVACLAAMVEDTGRSDTRMHLECMGVCTIGWMTTIIQSMIPCPRRSPAIICQCMKPHLRSQHRCHNLCDYREFVKIVKELLALMIHAIVLVNLIMQVGEVFQCLSY